MKSCTIFFQHKAIHFVEKTHELKPLAYRYHKGFSLEEMILQKSPIITVYCDHLNTDFAHLISKYPFIEAAGGMVHNANGDTLMIERHQLWDLPKGKYERGETIAQCAIREVQEECGLQEVMMQHFLTDTYHCYYLNEKLVIKKTYWFKMYSPSTKKLTPQTEEGITKVIWCKTKDIDAKRKRMYAAIDWVLRK
jgi:8-oxo-(d)GTP phosphatase